MSTDTTTRTSTHTTACPLDCPDTCSLDVVVEDGRLGALTANDTNPLTQGFICAKVRGYARHVHGPDRVLQPARRTGSKGAGNFENISWDEALDEIARRMLEVRYRIGGEAILPLSYGGSNGLLSQDTNDSRLFARLGASHLARTVCAAPSTAAATALYGRMAGVALEDYEHARLIIVWGANPSATGIHLVPIIRRAQEAGAKLVVVDPRRTPLAKKADLHLAVRPGTDVVLALSLIRGLFEGGYADREFLQQHCQGADELERRASQWNTGRAAATCQISEHDIHTLLELYAHTDPAVVRCGWGPERNRNGGSAIAAILALPAVAGKFGVRGGGYTMSNSGAWASAGLGRIAEAGPPRRIINMNRVGRSLLERLEPPIRFLFVYNNNPLVTLPDQERVRAGLGRENLFTVVFDQVWTETARYADIVLPATTFLEHDDLRCSYGSQTLQPVRAVLPPVGEARSNVEVFGELLERCGLRQDREAIDAASLSAAILGPAGIAEAIATDGIASPPAGRQPVQFVDVWPGTPDRLVRLVPDELDREAPAGLYGFRDNPQASPVYPLTLISPATSKTISSSLGNLRQEPAVLEIHPEDAAIRGLQKGGKGLVAVFNRLGEVHCHYRVDPDVRQGVVVLPKGLWCRQTANDTTSNVLVADDYTDIAGGATFNDTSVEVAALQ